MAVERVAGFAFASLRPTSSDRSFDATTFGIAGPALNPIALPRASVDALLPMGLTLGAAVGYGHAQLANNPDHGLGSSVSGNAWLISPRVGYLFHVAPKFDLWPRAGITFAGAGLQEADSQTCTTSNFNQGTPTTICRSSSGTATSLFVAAASVELAGVLRLTQSFNLLGGVAYDHVFAASGSQSNRGGAGSSTDLQPQGKYLGGQLWIGLGGYLL